MWSAVRNLRPLDESMVAREILGFSGGCVVDLCYARAEGDPYPPFLPYRSYRVRVSGIVEYDVSI